MGILRLHYVEVDGEVATPPAIGNRTMKRSDNLD